MPWSRGFERPCRRPFPTPRAWPHEESTRNATAIPLPLVAPVPLLGTRTGVRPDTSTLLPLDAYDIIVVGFSGGKDSLAALLHVLDLCDAQAIPRARVEVWHQAVDGDPDAGGGLYDWPVTDAYCRAVAHALGLTIRRQWREGGIEREMLRDRARTAPVTFELPGGGHRTVGGTGGKLGTRLRFPQLSADLAVRWCSSYAKIDVAATAICNDPRLAAARVLLVTGERREESPSRARYAAVERHKATTRRRRVDHWRPVLDWSEAEVWALIRRHRVRPHPAYRLGFGRVSCMCCVFGGANEWAAVRDLDASRFERVADYERRFGVTIRRGLTVVDQANRGRPFTAAADPELRRLAFGREYPADQVFVPADEEWRLPAGAYRRCGGPG